MSVDRFIKILLDECSTRFAPRLSKKNINSICKIGTAWGLVPSRTAGEKSSATLCTSEVPVVELPDSRMWIFVTNIFYTLSIEWRIDCGKATVSK